MAKVNVRESDPVRYEQVKAEQNALRREYGMHLQVARMCPYCQHRIEVLLRGQHGATMIKCPHCGEEVFFPPISFRIA